MNGHLSSAHCLVVSYTEMYYVSARGRESMSNQAEGLELLPSNSS